MSSYLPVNKIVRLQPEIDQIQCLDCATGAVWDALTIIHYMKHLPPLILTETFFIQLSYCMLCTFYCKFITFPPKIMYKTN